MLDPQGTIVIYNAGLVSCPISDTTTETYGLTGAAPKRPRFPRLVSVGWDHKSRPTQVVEVSTGAMRKISGG